MVVFLLLTSENSLNAETEEEGEYAHGVHEDKYEGKTRHGTDVTTGPGSGSRNGGKFWTYLRAVNTRTPTEKVVVRAVSGWGIIWIDLWWRGGREIDLERAAEVLLLAQETEEAVIVLGTSSNEVHSIRVGSPHLYILAAIEETCPVLLSDEEVEGCYRSLSRRRRLS